MDPLPPGQAAPPHAPVRLGDARMSDLLPLLAQAGVPAQFSAGGVLVAAGGTQLRRAGPEAGVADGDEALVLEGPPGEAFYAIKAVLERQWGLV